VQIIEYVNDQILTGRALYNLIMIIL